MKYFTIIAQFSIDLRSYIWVMNVIRKNSVSTLSDHLIDRYPFQEVMKAERTEICGNVR